LRLAVVSQVRMSRRQPARVSVGCRAGPGRPSGFPSCAAEWRCCWRGR
jgi:hypothetical protein